MYHTVVLSPFSSGLISVELIHRLRGHLISSHRNLSAYVDATWSARRTRWRVKRPNSMYLTRAYTIWPTCGRDIQYRNVGRRRTKHIRFWRRRDSDFKIKITIAHIRWQMSYCTYTKEKPRYTLFLFLSVHHATHISRTWSGHTRDGQIYKVHELS